MSEEEGDESTKPRDPQAHDAGWGTVVLVRCSIVQGFHTGVSRDFTRFQGQEANQYPTAMPTTPAERGLVLSQQDWQERPQASALPCLFTSYTPAGLSQVDQDQPDALRYALLPSLPVDSRATCNTTHE